MPYGDDEQATILRAAQIAGLRPSSYVAAAALTMAEQVLTERPAPAGEVSGGAARRRRLDTLTPHQDRELLAELLQARLALPPVRGQRQPGRRRAQQRATGAGLAAGRDRRC